MRGWIWNSHIIPLLSNFFLAALFGVELVPVGGTELMAQSGLVLCLCISKSLAMINWIMEEALPFFTLNLQCQLIERLGWRLYDMSLHPSSPPFELKLQCKYAVTGQHAQRISISLKPRLTFLPSSGLKLQCIGSGLSTFLPSRKRSTQGSRQD